MTTSRSDYKIIVCGGREFDDWALLDETLWPYDCLPGKKIIWITGEAKGADFLCRVWLKTIYIGDAWKQYYRGYPAKWKEFGFAAGGIRNQEMLDKEKPDLVIAFPGGSGTADMVRRARAHSVEVIVVENKD